MNQQNDIKDHFIELWKEIGREKIFRVRGTSMLPLIHECDALGVMPVSSIEQLKIGDIAVYKSGTGIIAHRIIGIYRKGDRTTLREKGDRGAAYHTISGQQIIGRVIKIYQPEKTLDLSEYSWVVKHRIIGYYWLIIFNFFDFISRIKTALFGLKKFPVLAKIYQSLVHTLINLPTIILRRR
jgi:uncharacterized protein (UPF0248 family)